MFLILKKVRKECRCTEHALISDSQGKNTKSTPGKKNIEGKNLTFENLKIITINKQTQDVNL